MRWIGIVQDEVRRAVLDQLAQESLVEASAGHDLVCARCSQVYDECDDPQCDHFSMPAGFCPQCSTANELTLRQTA